MVLGNASIQPDLRQADPSPCSQAQRNQPANERATRTAADPEPEVTRSLQVQPGAAMPVNGKGTLADTTARLSVRLPSGSVLPCVADLGRSAGELKVAVLVHCGHPPGTATSCGLALGFAALDDAATLQAGDVQDGDVLTLFPRSS